MYYLFPTILFSLSRISFATPAQPIDSLNLFAPGSNPSNAIGALPVDDRFTIRPVFSETSIDEDQFLVIAVQMMGEAGNESPDKEIREWTYWDDRFRDVIVKIVPPTTPGLLEMRFVVWGLYLGVKGMIQANHFMTVNIELRWQGRIVGLIAVRRRTPAPPLSEGNSYTSSKSLRQRALSNQSAPSTSESLGGDYSNLTVSTTLSTDRIKLDVNNLGDVLPKWDFIMAILEGILAVFSATPTARFEEPLVIQPAVPYDGVKLQVLPVQTLPGQPYMKLGLVSLEIRWLAMVCLWELHRWVEMKFNMTLNGVLIAKGSMSKA